MSHRRTETNNSNFDPKFWHLKYGSLPGNTGDLTGVLPNLDQVDLSTLDDRYVLVKLKIYLISDLTMKKKISLFSIPANLQPAEEILYHKQRRIQRDV